MRVSTKRKVAIGDYVLSTKWSDGDPCDHFYIGFVSGYTNHKPARYMVTDGAGNEQRGNGFRRAEVITGDEGRKLVGISKEIGDKVGPSLWWHLREIRNKQDA